MKRFVPFDFPTRHFNESINHHIHMNEMVFSDVMWFVRIAGTNIAQRVLSVFMKGDIMRRTIFASFAIATFSLCMSSAAHAAYTEKAVSGGGSIAGKVTFEGALPADAVEKITITKNPEVCDVDKTGTREVVWVDVKGGALRGSFVFIDKIETGKPWPAPKAGKFLVNQEGCRFRPWAQVVKPGPFTIKHSDPATVLHNINAREMIGVEKGRPVRSTIFNFAQPDPGEIVKDLKMKRSHYISLNCEAHNFMFGFMMAPEHPYAVVVGEDGSYTLDNVPPGEYVVKAWHPKFGLKEAKVTISAGGKAQASFAFSAK